MKKVMFLITVSLLLLISAICSSAAENNRMELTNTIYKLQNNLPLNIGYLGGSITAGTGASSQANCYRSLTTKWFKDNYPNSNITELNASIGGFGSIPNAFRLKSQLLVKNPDLIFVEAAVNDYSQDETLVKQSMEGVVRQIWEYNPKIEIVFIYTTSKSTANESYAKEDIMKTVKWHEEVAKYYNIPFINCGLDLYNAVTANTLSWAEALKDGTHPTDAGYQIYADSIASFLKTELSREVSKDLKDYKLPDTLFEKALDKADIIDSWEMEYKGFEKSDESMGGRHPHMIISKEKDAVASVKFKGNTVGLYWLKSKDGGMLDWWVDDGNVQQISACDDIALTSSPRGTYNILTTDLNDGEHTLHLKVTGEIGTNAVDSWIRIGGIFVSQRSDNDNAENNLKDAVILKLNSNIAIINDEKFMIDKDNENIKPAVINDRTLVPVRFISEAFNAEVNWDENTQTISIENGDNNATMTLGDKKLLINSAETQIDVAPQTIEDRTFVPMRILAETVLGKNVFWDERGIIIISDRPVNLEEQDIVSILDKFE